MADESGVVVVERSGKRVRYPHVTRFELSGGFLYLSRGEETVGLYAPDGWESVIKYGLGEEQI